VQKILAAIFVATFAGVATVPAAAQYYRAPPPLPGPGSYGYPGCPGGYISIMGDVCEPALPLMGTGTRAAYGCPPHYKLQDGICKRAR